MTICPILSGDFGSAKSKLNNCNVKRAKIVAIAFTKSLHIVTTATNQINKGSSKKWTFHAEENLIKKLKKLRAKERKGNISVLIMRWSIRKGWTIAKPCKNCLRDLLNYGIKEIYYTNNSGKIIKYKLSNCKKIISRRLTGKTSNPG